MSDLAYAEYGAGPPLVVLHGLFGSARNWTGIARRLADSYRILAVDLPNHGDSPWTETVSYEAMADEVGGFLDARGLGDEAAILGHSMGGKTAMALALRAPQRVARLIVVDIAPVAYDHDTADIVDALAGLPIDRLSSRKDADVALAASLPDPMLRSFLLANLVRDGERFAWRVNLDGIQRSLDALHGFPDLPGRYVGPTLVIRGESSHYVDDAYRPPIAERFPNARIETVAGAGHWVHAERPEAVVELVGGFLSEA